MKLLLARLIVVTISVAALIGHTETMNAAQKAKDKSKPEEKIDPVELEKQLLTIPEKMAERDAWLKTWQKYFIVGFRPTVGPQETGELLALSVDNRTPCTIKIVTRELLYKDGKRTKAEPPKDGWEVLAKQKIYLGIQPKLATMTIKQDMKAGLVVSSISRGKLADIRVTPNNTDLKGLDLVVMVEYGMRGNFIVAAQYVLVKPEEEKDFFKR